MGIDVGIGLHEVVDPSIQGSLSGGIVDLSVVIAGDREDGRSVLLVGLIELGVVVVVRAGEVDDVAYVIAELRRIARFCQGQATISLGDIGLELAILDTAGVA